MEKIIIGLLFLSFGLQCEAREVIHLEHWKFIRSDIANASSPDCDEAVWESVRVPHDWAIDQPFDMLSDIQTIKVKEDGETTSNIRTGRTGALPTLGVGWYRSTIPFSPTMKGKHIRVEFDGAMSLSKVYLNGKYVGEWPYGYSSFTFDLTDIWNNDGDNILAVRLENKPQSSRWYSGAGLYRNVRLVVTDPVFVAHWGTCVTTPVISSKKGVVSVATTVENKRGTSLQIQLKTSVANVDGKVLRTKSSTQMVSDNFTFNQQLEIFSPSFWTIENPYLYQVVSEVYVNQKLCDTYTTDFGFRTIRFDKDKGFFLNDKRVKLKGVCLHHDLGPLGAAMNNRALERQLEMMKEMGCNAIRTSHNPPSPELLYLCDRMGLVVQIEAFDEWHLGKGMNGYHVLFDKWAAKDLQAMIRRDRNHPSVIMWSIGNEVREQNQEEGGEVARMLTDICHQEDPTRPVTAGFSSHKAAIKNGLADVVDLVGFNYKPFDYKSKHKEYPNYVLYGSETASTVSSRGEYKFPAIENKGAYYEDYQLSSYDLEYPVWASTPDTEFEQQDDCNFILGEFVWTGFDYLGEPSPYNQATPAKSSYFGIVDLAGLKKDRFYLYQSRWSDRPVLHLLPHWNWEERMGQPVPVFCYTNYPKVELFVNGKSAGVRSKTSLGKYERYRLMWDDVVYSPGEIKVIAYDEDGKRVDSTLIRTAGETYQIRLTPDRKVLAANGADLSYILVEIVDKDGLLCPKANNLLFFEVKGSARLRALCNGDPTDQTAFSSTYMRAFNGKMVLVVEGLEIEGEATIHAFGGHLKSCFETIQTK